MRIPLVIASLLLATVSLSGQEVQIVRQELNGFYSLRDFCIAPGETEAYFTVQSPGQDLSQIVCVTHGRWDAPRLLPFCDGYSYLEPFLSHNGRRLYFASDRPKSEADTVKSDFDIWYVERPDKDGRWSKPVNAGPHVNSAHDEFYPTLADNGNLYFTMEAETGLGKDDIYYCKWNGESYSLPILLDSAINSDGYEFNAFISKDESFLIYTRYNATGGYGSGDLYLSKKNEQGAWAPAENMGKTINTRYMEYCPFYDSHTHTLYFTSRRNSLTPKTFKDLKEFLDYTTGSENGLSRIYKYPVKL